MVGNDATERIVCWFSCGVTSAVAAKLAVRDYAGQPLEVVYCDTGGEHPSNVAFLEAIQRWIGHPITILKNEKYKDHFDVFEKRKYIVGVHGAPCTVQLKKLVREQFQRANDLHIFGFSQEESGRANRLRAALPELDLEFNLIDNGLTKSDCLAMVSNAGIDLPEMYKLGYGHNNCIGCPKGQQGYWNKIRRDFPDVFDRMAKLERTLNAAINKSYAGDGERKRVFLDELDPLAGTNEYCPPIECSLFCSVIEHQLNDVTEERAE